MKFTYIGPNRIDSEGREWPVSCYAGIEAMTGEEVELEGHFAKKADKNPNFKRVRKPNKISEKQPIAQMGDDDGLTVD